ncbi:hypothetical protein ACTXT7_015572 [Hymenolepis weldensis]
MRDHRPNRAWAEVFIGVRRVCVVYKVNVNGQTLVRLRNHLRYRKAAKSPKLETGPLDIILDVIGLLQLENNGTSEIELSDQENLRWNVSGNT